MYDTLSDKSMYSNISSTQFCDRAFETFYYQGLLLQQQINAKYKTKVCNKTKHTVVKGRMILKKKN